MFFLRQPMILETSKRKMVDEPGTCAAARQRGDQNAKLESKNLGGGGGAGAGGGWGGAVGGLLYLNS